MQSDGKEGVRAVEEDGWRIVLCIFSCNASEAHHAQNDGLLRWRYVVGRA
jgi:hypothetical protein